MGGAMPSGGSKGQRGPQGPCDPPTQLHDLGQASFLKCETGHLHLPGKGNGNPTGESVRWEEKGEWEDPEAGVELSYCSQIC